jgi:galactose mutarotase-like enzyme
LAEPNLAETEENVVITAGNCRLTLLPAFGGSIASLIVDNRELLQTPLNPYAPRTSTQPFQDGNASGWDECLPSVGACELQTEAGQASVPDHGDLWRIPWKVLSTTDDSATLRATCFSLPLQLTRSMILSADKGKHQLQILYSVTNLGAYNVPWAWSAHPLFSTEPGDRVLLPDSIHDLHLEGSRNNRLGVHGDRIPWPARVLPDGSQDDLSLAYDPATGRGDKLSAGPLTNQADGWCTLERISAGLSLTVRFDPTLTPYLGLWLCYGGWPEGDGLKQVCVAIEPATAPVDSLATTGPWSRSLEPGETFTWPMSLEIVKL